MTKTNKNSGPAVRRHGPGISLLVSPFIILLRERRSWSTPEKWRFTSCPIEALFVVVLGTHPSRPALAGKEGTNVCTGTAAACCGGRGLVANAWENGPPLRSTQRRSSSRVVSMELSVRADGRSFGSKSRASLGPLAAGWTTAYCIFHKISPNASSHVWSGSKTRCRVPIFVEATEEVEKGFGRLGGVISEPRGWVVRQNQMNPDASGQIGARFPNRK
ncbi:hypothetical protein QBC40DRAFT_301076 [Triangularia verruculosa]|uniref:Uncharacterized protein n=1 Tax=Triangularia verruculosa TaxID=2587418 RepID=A0AAN6XD26_9PEZI|nr:hypothetical protein QBC40DRAFT_301076 [Triangularia verruculosa]